ncbi:DUF6542 domain-containing protein [Rhodococcus sp. NPDC058514]|uniref:DUF6542 domain-containing protein n=1 Tax=unclassified Rhodococcus (in: high G+C Gram-positive bacteria) TaxID=192944 RepID=UPI003656E058
MSATQRARSGVPLEMRSVLPTVPGVPAAAAVLIAVATTFVGFALDAIRGSELTSAFSVFYFLGCVGAVLAVRGRGLFATMVQPPLILFAAVPLAYQFFSAGSKGGLKDLMFNVAIPLVNRFPLMLVTTVAVLIIGGVRIYLGQQADRTPARAKGRPADPAAARTADRPATRPQAAARRTDQPRTAAAPRTVATPRPQQVPQTRPGHTVFRDPAPTPAPRRPVPPPPAPGGMGRRPERAPSAATARVQPPRSVVDPYSSPAHPIPQVRYRDREDPAHDQRGGY